MSPTQGLPASKPVEGLRTFGVEDVKDVSFANVWEYSSGNISNDGRKSKNKLPALAAQPRAFFSLLSLPSQAQSVIKAFRRQGIGYGRCV